MKMIVMFFEDEAYDTDSLFEDTPCTDMYVVESWYDTQALIPRVKEIMDESENDPSHRNVRKS